VTGGRIFFVGFEASREAGSLREIALHAPKILENSRQRQQPPSGGGMYLRGQKVLFF
jgi:hypothetical protein